MQKELTEEEIKEIAAKNLAKARKKVKVRPQGLIYDNPGEGKHGKNKLNFHQKKEVCKMIAEFRTKQEIRDYLNSKYDIQFSEDAVYYYVRKPKWMELIRQYREEWTEAISTEPFSNKRMRLEKLLDAYNLAMNGYTIGVNKQGEPINVKNPAAAVQAIRQAQAEMEGQPGNALHVNIGVGGDGCVTVLMPPKIESPEQWMALARQYQEQRSLNEQTQKELSAAPADNDGKTVDVEFEEAEKQTEEPGNPGNG